MTVTLIPETNDEARDLFADSGLTYDDLDRPAFEALQAFADIELARCRLDPKSPLQRSLRMARRITSNIDLGGGIKSAELFVNGCYFKNREAFTFNAGGYIVVAGWADSKNLRPFLVAFGQWVEWLSRRKEGMA